MIKTVGELKSELERIDDNTPILISTGGRDKTIVGTSLIKKIHPKERIILYLDTWVTSTD